MSDSTLSMPMHDQSTLFTSDFGSELNYTGGIDLSDLCLVDDFYSHSGLSSPLFPAYPTSLNAMPTSPSPSPRLPTPILPTPILPVPQLQPTTLAQSTPISPPSTASPAISPTPISKAFKCDLQCPHHQKNSQKPSMVPQLALVPIPQPGSLTESNMQSDPLPIRTLSKQMPQDMAARFKQQQERKEEARRVEEKQRQLKADQKRTAHVYLWHKDDAEPLLFIPTAISDYPYLNLYSTRTHFDTTACSLLQCLALSPDDDVDVWSHDQHIWSADVVKRTFELDGRPILLRLPGVKPSAEFNQLVQRNITEAIPVRKVLKRTLSSGMDILDPALLKRPCTPIIKACSSTVAPYSRSVASSATSPIGSYSSPHSRTPSPPYDDSDVYFSEPNCRDNERYIRDECSNSSELQANEIVASFAKVLESYANSQPFLDMDNDHRDIYRVCVDGVKSADGETSWPEGMRVKNMVRSFILVDSPHWVRRLPQKLDRIREVYGGLPVTLRTFSKQHQAWKSMSVSEWEDANGASAHKLWCDWRKGTQGWRITLDANKSRYKQRKTL
ncbi:hypothetical protein C8J55DRAFT_562956 [Lentinula edodes]|uniref:Uncharacterized protein n=1 Tax=Lentinula lateritia TaxID=40482 RepID=A0A9W9A3C2_9AGAR|nr:hypothetical protein C8J55DRAFT_562956 [Lentinula edodes]